MYQEHLDALCADEIEIEEFEERCKKTWIETNGPVPEGRKLYVGYTDNPSRLIVGHGKISEPINCEWKFKDLGLEQK